MPCLDADVVDVWTGSCDFGANALSVYEINRPIHRVAEYDSLCSIFDSYNVYRLFTARRSYASAVLGVVIMSVCMSHACFVTNTKNLPAIFLYHMKGQSF